MTDPRDRQRIAAGLWFVGSLMWAAAAATGFAGIILVVGNQRSGFFWAWVLGTVVSGVVTGYVLKGFSLLVSDKK
jgi:hypothetical protein